MDLKDDNNVVLEITSEDNDKLAGVYDPEQDGDTHLHSNEKYIIRLQEKFLLRVDIDLLLDGDENAIIRTDINTYASINDSDKRDVEYIFDTLQTDDEANLLYV